MIRVVCPDASTWWVSLKVTPKSAKNAWRLSDAGHELQLSIQAVPEDGKANKAVIAFVAQSFGLPKSRVTLLSGDTSRYKRLQLNWIEPVPEPAQVAARATGIDAAHWQFESV